MTISGGRANGANKDANGGAISSFFQAADPNFKPTLNINNVTFSDNQATLTSFSSGNAADLASVTTAQVSVDTVTLPAVTVRVVANLSQVFVPLVVR